MRQVFDKGFFMGGALASAMTVSKGKLPPKNYATHPNADARAAPHEPRGALPGSGRQAHFDKLSSVFAPATGRATTSRTTSGSRRRSRASSPRCGQWMCPAHVYEVGDADGEGTVEVKLTPSNCVQCGAISAKGGRLTPPEGGSGPEYTLT